MRSKRKTEQRAEKDSADRKFSHRILVYELNKLNTVPN